MNIHWVGPPYAMSLGGDHRALVDRRQLILSALGLLAVGVTGAKTLEEASAPATLPHPVTLFETTRLRSASDDSTAGAFLEATLNVMMG